MYSGGQSVLENQLKFSGRVGVKLEIKVANFFVKLTLDQRQRQYISQCNFLIFRVAWSATRDFVQKYDEDRIMMSADLGQILLWNGTKEY